jgi:hypothetical protein
MWKISLALVLGGCGMSGQPSLPVSLRSAEHAVRHGAPSALRAAVHTEPRAAVRLGPPAGLGAGSRNIHAAGERATRDTESPRVAGITPARSEGVYQPAARNDASVVGAHLP